MTMNSPLHVSPPATAAHSRFFSVAVILAFSVQGHFSANASDLTDYEWNVIDPDAHWAPRASLQVVDLDDAFYLMGGRTALSSVLQ